MAHPIEPIKCANPECDKSFRDHRWGSIKAHAEGWFTQKDGTAWCPSCTPDWVGAWRQRRGEN